MVGKSMIQAYDVKWQIQIIQNSDKWSIPITSDSFSPNIMINVCFTKQSRLLAGDPIAKLMHTNFMI